jgi:hypothetical protein
MTDSPTASSAPASWRRPAIAKLAACAMAVADVNLYLCTQQHSHAVSVTAALYSTRNLVKLSRSRRVPAIGTRDPDRLQPANAAAGAEGQHHSAVRQDVRRRVRPGAGQLLGREALACSLELDLV